MQYLMAYVQFAALFAPCWYSMWFGLIQNLQICKLRSPQAMYIAMVVFKLVNLFDEKQLTYAASYMYTTRC